jgi:galactose mutarotase-like enzyme
VNQPLITLASDDLSVEVCPMLGAEIRGIRHRECDENLLMKTPWAGSTSSSCTCNEVSEAHFVSHYVGGWQLMLPNMGFPSSADADKMGYHGEAWTRSWEILEQTDSSLILRTVLTTRPIEIMRLVYVSGDQLVVTDTVTNRSSDEIEFIWGHHPAFSHTLFDSTSEVFIAAKKIEVQGNSLSESEPLELPDFIELDERGLCLQGFTSTPYSFLAYLSDFDIPYARITNSTHDLTMELGWNSELFPHAWLWIENEKIADAPWNSQVRTLAIEPTSTIPNLGFHHAKKVGSNLVMLAANESKVGQVTVKVFKTVPNQSKKIRQEKLAGPR